MNKRSTIKTKIVSKLKAGLSCDIYKSRYLPLSQDEFNAICVYSPEESAEKITSNEGYKRSATIIIAGYVYGYDETEVSESVDDIDDKMDQMSDDIESILLNQYETLDGEIADLKLVSTKYFVNSEGDQIIGVVTMEWDAVYYDSVNDA